MGRKRLDRFRDPKMFSARVEREDFNKFELLMKRNGRKLQEVINNFVVEMVSGNLHFSGSGFASKEE